MVFYIMLEAQQKIMDLSIPEPNSGCWLWIGGLNDPFYPYGRIYFKRKNMLAHRLSYLAFKGPIPKSMLVCHHCDNGYCVNPDHLFVGTLLDNHNDLVRKGKNRFVQLQPLKRMHPKKLTGDRLLKFLKNRRLVADRPPIKRPKRWYEGYED